MFMLTYLITLVIGRSKKQIEVIGQFSLFAKIAFLLEAFDGEFTVADLHENWEERENVLLHRNGEVEITEELSVKIVGVADYYMDVSIGLTVNGQTFTGEPFGVYKMVQKAGFPAFKIFATLNAHNQMREIREGDEFDIDDLTIVITELSC